MAARVRSLTVKGFRAYGATEQTLNLPSEIAAIWAPNSKGKTSLAEAFEFLLTGRIVRRELMASSRDEFADALRNAHLSEAEEVYVAAQIVDSDATEHEIRRVLTSDYAKKQDCASRLEINGKPANEQELTELGVLLSQPPLQAPVLAQHTLSYIFSVRPQDRATYFKTLLEVTDLDDLRNDIGALADKLKPPEDPVLAKFDACCSVPALENALSPLGRAVTDLASQTAAVADAARALIEVAEEHAPETLEDRLAAIEKILADRRSKTFPVRWFEHAQLAGWNPPTAEIWARIDSYIEESGKVDEETRQLTALFDEALKLPTIAEIAESIDCPLCGTESALTPARVQLIRQHVENTRGFKSTETDAKAALSQLSASVDAVATAAEKAMPRYLLTTGTERRAAGFTLARIRELLADRGPALIDPWFSQILPLARAGAALRRNAQAAAKLIAQQAGDMPGSLDTQELRITFEELATARAEFDVALSAYEGPARALALELNEVIDAQADTAGWQHFIDVASQPNELRAALIERQARATVGKEFDAALRQIDRARESVLDDKFSDYSGLIQSWWERLRPEEQTFFSAVQPRKGAKRTIDFKAGLSANADRSAPKLRDVIAVFSHSQLHCLGLALFLARAEHEGFGFIVLDDPILSSDEDYRGHFNTTVVSALLDLPMQVIVLTQDHDTWEELENRYRHINISTAQLFVETPAEGSIIENTSDALLAKITRAKSLARGGHPDLRKECGIQLRDAGELFCKEMLVKQRRANGDDAASLTDYDGKILEWLCPRVQPLLDRDPSHPGKLEAFKTTVNHACHDNAPPGTGEMTHACGEIAFLQKEYLDR